MEGKRHTQRKNEEATERTRWTKRGWWKPSLMQWRKGKADEGKTAPEKSQGWKRLKRWLPPSGCNFSVVWFSLTTCGQHGLATTWLEGRGDPRNGKLCSTKQMYPLFHFLRRTQFSQIYSLRQRRLRDNGESQQKKQNISCFIVRHYRSSTKYLK